MSGYVTGRTSIRTIQTTDLADNAVTSAKINDDAVTSAKINDSALNDNIFLNGTNSSSANAGSALILDASAASTDVGSRIMYEDGSTDNNRFIDSVNETNKVALVEKVILEAMHGGGILLNQNSGGILYEDDTFDVSSLRVWADISALSDTDTSKSGSITLDFATTSNFILTFTGNVTLTNPTTEAIGQSGIIICIQDGTGSRTLSLGTDYETAAAGGITLSTAANSVDILPYFVQSASNILLGAVQKAFA